MQLAFYSLTLKYNISLLLLLIRFDFYYIYIYIFFFKKNSKYFCATHARACCSLLTQLRLISSHLRHKEPEFLTIAMFPYEVSKQLAYASRQGALRYPQSVKAICLAKFIWENVKVCQSRGMPARTQVAHGCGPQTRFQF